MTTRDDAILDAALQVVELEGLRGATTRRIADVAGVNEVTLFRRFGSKDQLLCEAFRRRGTTLDALLPSEPVDPEAELSAWVMGHAVHLHRSRSLIRSALTEMVAHPMVCSAAHARPRQIAAMLETYLERLRQSGRAPGDWSASAATRMLMGALFGELVADPMMNESTHEFDPEAIAARYVPLLLRAIGVERGPAR
ncbi:MAG: TetR/AcrR family transcriptional regulator [Myxococcota bacterium]